MRFVVLASKAYLPYAAMTMTTIRHYHPESEIVHMGPPGPLPELADTAWQSTEFGEDIPRLIRAKCAMLSEMGDAATAILDADTLVTTSLHSVWVPPFDVALTIRQHKQPYNSGVMFSRCAGFWQGMLERMDADPHYCSWGGDQEALAMEAKCGKWKVLDLPCTEWNSSTVNQVVFPKLPKGRIVHYKGPRKEFMRKHFELGWWKR